MTGRSSQLVSRQVRRLVPEFFGLGPELCDPEILGGLDGGGDQFCFEATRVGFDVADDRTRVGDPNWIVSDASYSATVIKFDHFFQKLFGLRQLPHMQASHGPAPFPPTQFIEIFFNIDLEILAG
jgi:hypothetical protein